MAGYSDITDEVIGELSKLGKTAADQIKGKSASSDIASKVASQANPQTPSLWNEITKFAQSATAQVSGDKPITSTDIAKMAKKDDKFSQGGQEEVRQKILQIYREYEKKKKHKEMVEAQTEKQQEQHQLAELQERQEAKSVVSPAVGKARAEIGKNYGSE